MGSARQGYALSRCACLLLMWATPFAALAQATTKSGPESSSTSPTSGPSQASTVAKGSTIKATLVSPLSISPPTPGTPRFVAKLQLRLEAGSEDTVEPYYFAVRLVPLQENLVEVVRPVVVPGEGLQRMNETSGQIGAMPDQVDMGKVIPLVQSGSTPAKNFRHVLMLQFGFKPALDRLNFACQSGGNGAFEVELLATKASPSAKEGDYSVIGKRICVGPLPEPAAPKQIVSEEEAISLATLYLERALVLKTTADELFLRGQQTQADGKYAQSLRSLGEVSKFRPDQKLEATRRLLDADIKYRRMLIALNLDFWGGYRTGTPGIPIRHLIALEDLVADFDKVMTQIDASYNAKVADEADVLKAKSALQEVTGKLNAYQVEKERGVVLEQRERRMISISWSELKDIQFQQARIAKRLQTLGSLQKNLQNQANKMLTNAVAKSAGIDVGLLESVRTGKVDDAIKQYITSQVSDTNSDLMKQVRSFSSDTQKFVDLYARAKQGAEDLKALKGEAEFAAEAIRQPSLERLQQLGNTLLSSMPPAERAQLESKLKAQLPAAEWIRSAQSTLNEVKETDTRLRQIVSTEISKGSLTVNQLRETVYAVRDRVVTESGQFRSVAEISGISKQVFSGLADSAITAEKARAALIAVTKAIPDSVVRQWPPELVSALRTQLKVPTNDELVAQLERGALGQLAIVEAEGGKIVVRTSAAGSTVKVDVAELLVKLDVAQSSAKKAAGDMSKLFDSLLLEAKSDSQIVLAALPVESLTSIVAKNPGKVDGGSLSTSIQLYLDQKALLSSTVTTATSRAVGATYAGTVFDAAPLATEGMDVGTSATSSPEEADPESSNSGQPDPATSAVISGLLDAAFPGAGVAFSLAQTFASMDANRDLADRLAAEGARLMARKNELVDRQSERYADAMLAELEQRRAQALADSSGAQISTFQSAMRTAIEESNIQRARIGIRRAWAFYLAERMREEFDLFDRSYALWSRGKSERGVVEQEIKSDPQNVRYALDSQIQLFDWLDRTREASKTDPDVLRVHWNKMLRLAKDTCQKTGCKPGDGLLGQVGNTRQVRLIEELASAHDRARFAAWQKNPLGPFRAEIQISPMSGLLPPSAQNVRLIDVRLGRLSEDGQISSLEQVTLSHSGVSYIGIPDDSGSVQFRLESMLSRTASSFNTPNEFDLEALRTRYDAYFTGSNLPSSRVFEGYGFYATYEITIEPTQTNRTLKDIIMRAGYYYQPAAAIASEAAFLRKFASGDAATDRISNRFPELSPYELVAVSDTRNCTAPLGTDEDMSEFQRSDVMPLHSYEEVAFFGGRTRPTVESSDNQLTTEARRKISLLRNCSAAKLERSCRLRADVIAQAESLGRRLDNDPTSVRWVAQLGVPQGTKLEAELRKRAEAEYQQAGCAREAS